MKRGNRFLAAVIFVLAPALCVAQEAARQDVPVNVPVEMKIYLFTVPDSFDFGAGLESPGIAGVYSREEGERLVDDLGNRLGFAQVGEGAMIAGAKADCSREMKLVRDFIYPTEYTAPEVDEGGRPVTPAAPTAFQTKELGVVVSGRGKPAEDGRISIDVEVNRSAVLGFVNYGAPISAKEGERTVVVSENRILSPVFDVKQAKGLTLVKDGGFIAVAGLNPGPLHDKERFEPLETSPEASGKNLVALIQVGEPNGK